MSLLKGIAIFVGWVTSSLAGIGAILYACGYLITSAQLHLLGLDTLIHFSNEQYIQEGGQFFITLAQQLGDIFLSLVITVAVFALPIILIIGLIALIKKELLGQIRAVCSGVFHKFNNRWPALWRALIFTLLLSILFIASEDPQAFDDALEISNLLYVSNEVRNQDNISGIKILLIHGDRERLESFFTNCLLLELFSGVLLFTAWHVVAPWRWRLFAVSPFILIFMLYTIFLPMLYGVLQHEARFPVITLASKNPLLSDRAGKLFLLDNAEKEFVLWDEMSKKVLWLPKTEVTAAEVHQIELLFKKSDSNMPGNYYDN